MPVGKHADSPRALQHAATRLADAATEHLLAVLADHLFGGHAEQALRGLVYTDDAQVLVVKEQGVGKLVEDRFQDLRPLPLCGEMRHRTSMCCCRRLNHNQSSSWSPVHVGDRWMGVTLGLVAQTGGDLLPCVFAQQC